MKTLLRCYCRAAVRYRKSEDGAITAFGLYVLMIMATLSIFGLEVAHLMSARSQLQIAADSAAHAALYYRELNNAEDSRTKALAVAFHGAPYSRYGEILDDADIVFGDWDYDTDTFIIDNTSRNAVMVTTQRNSSKSNAIVGFLSHWIGKDTWDVVTPSVFTTYRPTCLREGFVADNIVDIQSNNGYYNGFCIHANNYVSMNTNNIFEAGTIVSMPNEGDLDLPQSGFETNEGLQAALREGVYRLRILNRIDSIITGLQTGDPLYTPDYIGNTAMLTLPNKMVDDTDFVSGRIHTYSCATGGQTLTIGPSAPGAVLKEIVLVTDCQIKFNQGVILEDVRIATTSTSNKSISSPASLQIGADDDCGTSGGAQLVTKGTFDVAADLKVFGGQVLALGDILFAANADGIEGASFVAGGNVDGTSNMTMGFCGNGMEDNFEAEYFRLAG